jgi:hypothetical protein
MLVMNPDDAAHYTISLVGIDGRTVARATAAYGDQKFVPFPGSGRCQITIGHGPSRAPIHRVSERPVAAKGWRLLRRIPADAQHLGYARLFSRWADRHPVPGTGRIDRPRDLPPNRHRQDAGGLFG